MENHKISIENLGPIKKIENFEVKKINIVIGESASGKSVLAMAIAFFNDKDLIEFLLKDYGVEYEDIEYEEDMKYYGNSKYLIRQYFPSYKGYKIKYLYSDDLYIELRIKTKSVINPSPKLKELIDKSREKINKAKKEMEIRETSDKLFKLMQDKGDKNLGEINENKFSFDDIEIENVKNILKEIDIKTPYQIQQDFFKKLGVLQTVFIPATRSFVSDFDEMRLWHLNRHHMGYYPAGNKSLRMFSDSYAKYLGGFEKLDKNYISLMRGDVSKDEGGRINLSIKNQKLDISELSSGQKELFPIILILQEIVKRKERCFLIIEEPEAHLFPKDQRLIFDTIIQTINKTNSKVFITTHSPYMLMSANNLIEAEKKKYKALKDKFIETNNISVHKLSDGGSESIFDKKTNLIDGDYIEGIVDEICEQYDEILKS